MKWLKFFSLVLVVGFFLKGQQLYAQASVTGGFEDVLLKIAKKETKEQVIKWISTQDPILGIVAVDLIGQVIDSAAKPELSRSTINVATTMLFLDRVQHQLGDLITSNPSILTEAKKVGWTQEELLAYSSLYFYYSERLKYKLYISPHIFTLDIIKSKVESLQLNEVKWTTQVSKFLLITRAKNADVLMDVRTLEVLQHLFNQQLNLLSPGTKVLTLENSLIKTLQKRYKKNKLLKVESVEDLLSNLFQESLKTFEQNLKKYTQKNNLSELSFSLTIRHKLLMPLQNIVASSEFSVLEPERVQSQILQSVKDSFSSWLAGYKSSNEVRFDYGVMLAGVYFSDQEKVNFTLADQLRFGYFPASYSLFVYVSGILDALVKEASNNTDKYYFYGVGANYGNWNLSVGMGVPYSDLDADRQPAVILGYEVPLQTVLGF